MKSSGVVKVFICLVTLLFVLSGFAFGDTHTEVQAIDADGYGTHPDLFTFDKVIVEGILLNRPEFLLDPTPNEYVPYGPGGQWQIYIRGEDDDHAGTAIWMGQCYDNIPGGDGTYTDQEWLDEIYRLSNDPLTDYEFAPGDRVKVTGLLKFYRGKTNINERHSADPYNDLTIELVEAGAGLPQPEVITLDDVKDGNDNFIFDPSRLTGCEYYQGRLVKINNVSFVDASSWGPDADMEITDGHKTFPVKLGRGWGFRPGSSNLSEPFDVVGIFDQESASYIVCNDGYRLWVPNYDGNSRVLTDRAYGRYNLAGEINRDGKVGMFDFVWFADSWLECVPGSGGCGGGGN
ncbi:MAG: hypothetical protein GWN55_11660 [Phycisphaerae bacterium]|nr:hypothetical protein [Phycisphaerae bacterium]NIU27436.1 hypothetical protein [candidate division KSB1 bacterium]NIP55626.1 hypothetical protein [Phycisphaerae bacterium]NIS54305.1 hypothetical protein [Phycisphaerae bacterium]NIV01955.1 hypothetical protein [Phycisphaerae bacterium]